MSERNLPETVLSSQEDQANARQRLLDKFAEQPDDNTIWQAAFEWVRDEGDHTEQSGIASDIPGEELINLANAVRSAPQSQRYNLVTATASNGKSWFDVLETFGSEQLKQAKKEIISSWVYQSGTPVKFQQALDLGTGTGNSLDILEENAERVVGIDRNSALLAIAKKKAGKNTRLVRGEVDELPFSNGSFDLAASSGLTGSLDRASLRSFYTELARVLKPNGIYVELSFWPFDGYVSDEDARITASSKAMLSDMIVDTVSGKHQIVDHLSADEQSTLLQKLGLEMKYYDVPSANGGSRNLLSVITKLAAEAEE